MIPTLLVALAVVAEPWPDAAVYSGVKSQLRVHVPRIDAQISVDGALDEPAWRDAATLTGFSQYSPVDRRPATSPTEVLVWYSPTAIYFGIRAYAPPGSVHAALANRDKIDADDNVQIFISTFNDGRQALMFGVNPLGIQADGAMSEGSTQARVPGTSAASLQAEREPPDLSPDYVFESKGRLTDYGYEVEIRIPFKSLRYQAQATQDWGIQIVRRVQSSGEDDTWTPATRAASSFLSQSGTLEGLTDLRRGLVLDLNPIVTAKIDGASDAGTWKYGLERPQFGGNLRWGMSANMTLNGTIKPDFSHVEADEAQFSFDPRRAVFFPEKRPFFLEAIEQFNTPNQLIYTRRIAAPDVAAKITGKVSGTNVAVLSAIDGQGTSIDGLGHPIVNVFRLQRDIAGESRAAFVYTGRLDNAYANHVMAGDARLVFDKVYNVQVQLGSSVTRNRGITTTAPIWEAILSRNGRLFGIRYRFTGIHPDFVAANGFLSRAGIVDASIDHRWTFYGTAGSRIQSFTPDVEYAATWRYADFIRGHALEKQLHFNSTLALTGGWKLRGSAFWEWFAYDRDLYANYALRRTDPGGVELLPFTGGPTIPNLEYVVSVDTPQFSKFSGTFFILFGHDENFFEWSSAYLVIIRSSADWRPTEHIRVNVGYQLQRYNRRSDNTNAGARHIPRLKVEYQLTRSIFLRMVGQYTSERQADLRDDTRTNLPIVIRDAAGVYSPALAFEKNNLRVDWLFSYQPSPGTVIFAGYGRSLADPDSLRSVHLHRVGDGFFLKWSYLFRM